MVVETTTETKPGLVRPFLGNEPSYYEDIGDLGLQQTMRDSGMKLDARNSHRGLSRNRLTSGTFYSGMVGLTLPEFTLLLKELQNRFIVPPPELLYQSARTRGTNYFDRIAIDATFALAYYCRQDQEFMGILRMPGREEELPWQQVLHKTRTGLGESILAKYILDPSQPSQIKPTFQIESNKPTLSNLDERERDPNVPLLEFDPKDYQIYAPAVLTHDQGLCDQPPFDRVVDIISLAYGIDPYQIKYYLVTDSERVAIGEKARQELLGYLNNFPYWRDYFRVWGKGAYDNYGEVKTLTGSEAKVAELYKIVPFVSENFGPLEEEYIRNRDTSKPPLLAMAESYGFFASRVLLNRQQLDPSSRKINPVKSYRKSILSQLLTGTYQPTFILWSITPNTASKLETKF